APQATVRGAAPEEGREALRALGSAGADREAERLPADRRPPGPPRPRALRPRTMASVEAATDKIVVKLPDGTPLELPAGATGADAAAAIGPGRAKAALAIKVDGALRDLDAPLPEHGAEVSILTERDPEALELIRHDAAHVMAEAVTELYPGTKVTIGPPIESGFYYDFEFPPDTRITEDDLPKIEKAMEKHIAADEGFSRRDVPVAEALEIFRAQDQGFKVELIEDLVKNE